MSSSMNFDEVGQSAEQVANRLQLDGGWLADLARWITERPDPAGHTVRLGVAWSSLEDLPENVRRVGSVSRAEVFELADECRSGQARWFDLLCLSYAWGMGTTGYGRHRWDVIAEDTSRSDIETNLGTAVALLDDDAETGTLAAYFHLNNRSAGRIGNLGPAFFTKFLYFAGGRHTVSDSQQRPLILDAVLARQMRRASDGNLSMPAAGFTTPQYATYLAVMRRLAQAEVPSGPVATDAIEYAAFRD